MTRSICATLWVLSGVAGCSSPMLDALNACEAAGHDGSSCVVAGDFEAERGWQGALKLYIRGCSLGDAAACSKAAELGDRDSSLRACDLGVGEECQKWLVTVGEHPRRYDVLDRFCAASLSRCAHVLHRGPVRSPQEFERALRICDSDDLESCRIVAAIDWRDPEMMRAIKTKSCDRGSGHDCYRLGAPSLYAKDPAKHAAALALIERGCTLGDPDACRAVERRVKCKSGSQPDCALIGRELVADGEP